MSSEPPRTGSEPPGKGRRRKGRRQHGEGSVYRRSSDKRWAAVAYLGVRNGKRDRRYFYGGTAEDALDDRGEFLARRRDGFTLPKGRPPTVGEYARHWLYSVARGRVRDTTWHSSYRSKTELHVIPYWDRTPLTLADDGVDEDKIGEWDRWLASEQGLSAASVIQCHRILSMVLNTAVIRKRLPRNPAANVHPRPDPDREEPVPPDEGEILAILAETEGRRSEARWKTSLATGARQGEVLGLLWPFVHVDDVDDAWIAVEWELVRLPWQHGCDDQHACGTGHHRVPCAVPCPRIRASGRPHRCTAGGDPGLCPPGCTGHARACPQRKDGGLRLQRPKSAKSRRLIPVDRQTALSIRAHRKRQLEERVEAGQAWKGWQCQCAQPPPEEAPDRRTAPRRGRRKDEKRVVCPDCRLPCEPLLVFTQRNGRPADSHDDWEEWGEILDKAGVGYVGQHTGTRHAYATGLLEEGIDIRVVQELMGHATPDFTRRAYQHVKPKLKRDAADAMARRHNGEGTGPRRRTAR